jgi:TetR/AcrR family transcriptional repressor of nem operon
VANYLSTEHRDNPRHGCPLAALGSEMARADTQTRATATAGFLKLVDALAGGLDEGTPDEARRRAMVAALTLIGALTVCRSGQPRDCRGQAVRGGTFAATG